MNNSDVVWPRPPADLSVTRVDVHGAELIVFSFALGRSFPWLHLLTGAEQEVAISAAQGMTNKKIARARATSENTVAKQMQAIYRKVGVESRRQLLALAKLEARVDALGAGEP